MKNFLALLLVFALSFMLVACNTENEDTSSSQAESSASTADSSAENNDKSTTDEASTEKIDESVDDSVAKGDITVEETVIYDENDIKVTVSGMKENALLGTEINVLIENNTKQNITVSAQSCTVNGLMITPIFVAEVSAGKKANSSLILDSQSLKVSGISVIKDIEIQLYAYDTDSWDDIFTTEPLSFKTTADDSYVQEYSTEGRIVYEENGVKVVAQQIDTEGTFGTDIYFYIENNSEEAISISAVDVSVNGFMVTPLLYCDITPSNKAITAMTVFTEDLTDNNIEKITEIEFKLDFSDPRTFMPLYESEIITLKYE